MVPQVQYRGRAHSKQMRWSSEAAKSIHMNFWLTHTLSLMITHNSRARYSVHTHTHILMQKTTHIFHLDECAHRQQTMHTNTATNFSSISFTQISLCPLSTVAGWHEYYSLLNPTSHIWLGNSCSPAGEIALNTKGDNYIPLLGLARDEGLLYCSRPWPLYVPVCLQVRNNDKGTLCDVT